MKRLPSTLSYKHTTTFTVSSYVSSSTSCPYRVHLRDSQTKTLVRRYGYDRSTFKHLQEQSKEVTKNHSNSRSICWEDSYSYPPLHNPETPLSSVLYQQVLSFSPTYAFSSYGVRSYPYKGWVHVHVSSFSGHQNVHVHSLLSPSTTHTFPHFIHFWYLKFDLCLPLS